MRVRSDGLRPTQTAGTGRRRRPGRGRRRRLRPWSGWRGPDDAKCAGWVCRLDSVASTGRAGSTQEIYIGSLGQPVIHRGDWRGLWGHISSIDTGGSTGPRIGVVAAASTSQVSRPLWMAFLTVRSHITIRQRAVHHSDGRLGIFRFPRPARQFNKLSRGTTMPLWSFPAAEKPLPAFT
jgi:hypothetical protein